MIDNSRVIVDRAKVNGALYNPTNHLPTPLGVLVLAEMILAAYDATANIECVAVSQKTVSFRRAGK